MGRMKILLMVVMLLGGTMTWFGCSKKESAFEKAGKQLNEATDKAVEEIEKAKEELDEATDKAVEEIEKAKEEAEKAEEDVKK